MLRNALFLKNEIVVKFTRLYDEPLVRKPNRIPWQHIRDLKSGETSFIIDDEIGNGCNV